MDKRKLPSSILFLTNFSGIFGGSERCLLNILNALPPSIRIYLVGAQNTETLLDYIARPELVSVFNVPYDTYAYLAGERQSSAPGGRALQEYLDAFFEAQFHALYTLNQLLQGRNVEFVHSNTSVVALGGLYARLHGKRHIWHAREALAVEGQAQRLWAWLMDEWSDAIVVPSQATAAGYGRKCVVIPDGFDGPDFLRYYSELASMDLVARFNIQPEDRVLLCLGVISERKGQVELVQAISHLLASPAAADYRLRVLIAGFCPASGYEQEVRRLVSEHGLERVVTLTGMLPYSEAMALLKRADILVQPSPLPDPFPNVIIEAMLAGKPVVASQVGGLPEMIEDGDTGLLCRPNDAQDLAAHLLRLLDDWSLATRLGERAERVALSRFDIRRTIEGLTGLYDRLLSSPAGQEPHREAWQGMLMRRAIHWIETIQAHKAQLASTRAALETRETELASAQVTLQARDREISLLGQELHTIYASKTWRIASLGLRAYQFVVRLAKPLLRFIGGD
jgi:glycosyltransferase involved in cell wall biosynthesis